MNSALDLIIYGRLSKDYCLYGWILFSNLSHIFCLSSNVFNSNMHELAFICLQGVWSWRTTHEDAPWRWWMWIGQDLSLVHLVFFTVWYKDFAGRLTRSKGSEASESPECWSKVVKYWNLSQMYVYLNRTYGLTMSYIIRLKRILGSSRLCTFVSWSIWLRMLNSLWKRLTRHDAAFPKTTRARSLLNHFTSFYCPLIFTIYMTWIYKYHI